MELGRKIPLENFNNFPYIKKKLRIITEEQVLSSLVAGYLEEY